MELCLVVVQRRRLRDLTILTRVSQVVWCCVMGAAHRRDSLQRCGLLCHHLGRRQQQFASSCSLHLPRWVQDPHETNMVGLD